MRFAPLLLLCSGVFAAAHGPTPLDELHIHKQLVAAGLIQGEHTQQWLGPDENGYIPPEDYAKHVTNIDWETYWAEHSLPPVPSWEDYQREWEEKAKDIDWQDYWAKVAGSWKDYYEEAKENGILDDKAWQEYAGSLGKHWMDKVAQHHVTMHNVASHHQTSHGPPSHHEEESHLPPMEAPKPIESHEPPQRVGEAPKPIESHEPPPRVGENFGGALGKHWFSRDLPHHAPVHNVAQETEDTHLPPLGKAPKESHPAQQAEDNAKQSFGGGWGSLKNWADRYLRPNAASHHVTSHRVISHHVISRHQDLISHRPPQPGLREEPLNRVAMQHRAREDSAEEEQLQPVHGDAVHFMQLHERSSREEL